MDKADARIELVARMSDEFLTTLDAYSAISRLRMLIDDINLLKETFAEAVPKSPYSTWRSFPIEIVSFYPVGFVTCLEWHARARLADLLTFKPDAIQEEDLKKDVGIKTLCRLVGQNVSVPHFIAVTRNFSTAETYIGAIERVFAALDLTPAPKKLIHGLRSGGGLAALDGLYSYRNTLVHEINQTHVGHPFFHDHLDCDAALDLGRFTLEVVETLEGVISASAPRGFPRRLTLGGDPINVDDEITSAIAEIEAKIERRLGESHGFKDALQSSRSAMAAEGEMIFQAHELHNRWLDLKGPVRRALLRSRLTYLKALAAALDIE